MKIGILKVFRKMALKIALKGFKEKGIEIVEDKIKIDIKKDYKRYEIYKFRFNRS